MAMGSWVKHLKLDLDLDLDLATTHPSPFSPW